MEGYGGLDGADILTIGSSGHGLDTVSLLLVPGDVGGSGELGADAVKIVLQLNRRA